MLGHTRCCRVNVSDVVSQRGRYRVLEGAHGGCVCVRGLVGVVLSVEKSVGLFNSDVCDENVPSRGDGYSLESVLREIGVHGADCL